jgi:hypothetical protein
MVSSRNAARIPGIDPAAQVVEQIVRRGTPAAAFQPTKLLDRPSLAFVHDFYRALAKPRFNLRSVFAPRAKGK